MLENVLAAVGENACHFPDRPLTAFDTLMGAQWGGGLLVVGRAVNGWHGEWNPEEVAEPRHRRAVAEAVRQAAHEGRTCPMSWVTAYWGTGQTYSTTRSAFWRMARAVTRDLKIADTESAAWPSFLAWTNLYRVAPAAGGNPSRALQRVQEHACAAALAADLDRLQPRRLLFLTGYSWAKPFLDLIGGWVLRFEGTSAVEATGQLRRDRLATDVVVAQHPQGKPEALMARAINAAWQNETT